jgi:hypothetical protein
MKTRVDQVHARASWIHGQIATIIYGFEKKPEILAELEKLGSTRESALKPYYDMLNDLYADELPVATLKDTSDILVRAIGFKADHGSPWLSAVERVASDMKKNLMHLSASVLELACRDGAKLSRDVPWVFNGYAHGSIMMGFSLRNVDNMILGEDMGSDSVFNALRNAAQSVAIVPSFLSNGRLSKGITEGIADPAVRDAAIIAAWRITPTSVSGIDSVEIGARNGGFGVLSGYDRATLSNAINQPLMSKRHGSFTGTMRIADADKHRAVLREVTPDIHSLKCIMPKSANLKHLFNEQVRVTGDYEVDKDGKPSLFLVDNVEVIAQPKQEEAF